MKIVHVIGARPQFVKAAPVLRAMQSEGGVDSVLIHTGQHFDPEMSDVFFEDLGLPTPDIHLGIAGGRHGEMTGRMIVALEPALLDIQPDWVVVYGDTNTTLAAAIAGSKLQLRLGHVEAGLRSFNRAMPEELNRIVTDHLSTLCLAPTDAAIENLRAEGIAESLIHRTGDVMFDAVRLFTELARSRSTILDRLSLEPEMFVLATLHRAENTDDVRRLRAAVEGLAAVAVDLPVVLPLHPRTSAALQHAGIDVGSVQILPPVGYLEMLALESAAAVIVTDSGGVQKEAFFHRRPCVTLRDETEWVELVHLGWNRVVPPVAPEAVATAVKAAIGTIGDDAQPYGDGNAATEITRALVSRSRSAD